MKKIEQLKNVVDALAKAQKLGQYPAAEVVESVKSFGKLKNRAELEEVAQDFEEVGSDYRPDYMYVDLLGFSKGKDGINGVIAVEWTDVIKDGPAFVTGRPRLIKMTKRGAYALYYNSDVTNMIEEAEGYGYPVGL